MTRYVVDLHIPGDELLWYYRGAARGVLVTARSGERVRFPAEALRSFVGHDGVRGAFVLDVDTDNRLRRIARLT